MVKLSIVIPYYKTYELTKKLMEVLIPQLTPEVELFLIDDECTEKRLDEYAPAATVIHMKKNSGGASAMNVGIKKATGKYIAIIDSDDLVATNYIEELLKAIDEHQEDVIFFDWQDQRTKQIIRRPNNYAPWKAIYKREIMPLFRDGWIYSYDVPFQEDLDKTNYSRAYLDKVLYYYYSERPGNLTQKKREAIARGE